MTAEDIVITVADKPVSLGGIMGGASTEIDNNSKNVVLEAAVLMENPFVRQVAVLTFRFRIVYSRFEKGVNNDTVLEALIYAAAMQARIGKWILLLQAAFKPGSSRHRTSPSFYKFSTMRMSVQAQKLTLRILKMCLRNPWFRFDR
ncbi:MAG: phenylalanine--tRNA ligase beta subunit-related protein [Streptococcus thermophilus]